MLWVQVFVIRNVCQSLLQVIRCFQYFFGHSMLEKDYYHSRSLLLDIKSHIMPSGMHPNYNSETTRYSAVEYCKRIGNLGSLWYNYKINSTHCEMHIVLKLHSVALVLHWALN